MSSSRSYRLPSAHRRHGCWCGGSEALGGGIIYGGANILFTIVAHFAGLVKLHRPEAFDNPFLFAWAFLVGIGSADQNVIVTMLEPVKPEGPPNSIVLHCVDNGEGTVPDGSENWY